MSNDSKSNSAVCGECDKKFSNISNLRMHIKRQHSVEKLEELAPRKKFKPASLCFECGATFVKQSNLNKHIKNKHPDQLDLFLPTSAKSAKTVEGIICILCSTRHKSRTQIMTHYKEAHEINIENMQIEFESFDDFLLWKREVEEKTVASFVNMHGQYRARNYCKVRYECHRSGLVRSSGKNPNNMKMQRSHKMNGHCPASMSVFVTEDKCEVQFCTTHIGHQCELEKLSLTKDERQELAEKIASNVPFSDILEEIKSSAENEATLQRIHLVRKKDLHNIKKSLCASADTTNEEFVQVEVVDEEETKLFRPQNVKYLVKFLRSAAPTSSSYEISLMSKFNDVEQEKILSVLNKSSKDDLLSFNVGQSKIKNLENYKKRKGLFKSLDDLLDVDGVSLRLLEKLCKQIISDTPAQTTVKPVNNDKKLKQILSPTLPANHSISSAVGIHLATVGVSWAEHHTDGSLVSWNYRDLTDLPKKMLPTDTFNLAIHVLNQLPVGDVYIFEGNSNIGSLQGQKQLSTVTSYTQQMELMSMLVALINTSAKHNNQIRDDQDECPNCVYFLRPKLPARLFKTLVGNECVSSTNSILRLLGELPSEGTPLPLTQVSLDNALKNYYVGQSPAQKELLGQSLMLTLAFMDVCIRRNPASLKALLVRR